MFRSSHSLSLTFLVNRFLSRVATALFALLALSCLVSAGVAEANDGPLSSTDQLITVSLVPDGTLVGQIPSRLKTRIANRIGGDAALRLQVARACQRWASPTNLNFWLVNDSGAPLGTRGLPRQDVRFGDVRIAAIPLPNGVRGVAFARDNVLAGTWAGDIILNSNYNFSEQSILQVLMHELGHVLGFDHVQGVSSVLNPTNARTTLADIDLSRLRARYGARDLDTYDQGRGNGSLSRASTLRMGYTNKGTLPVLAFGDLGTATDSDYFSFRADSKLTGRLNFQLRTLNNSLAAARIQVLDKDGRLILQATTSWQGTGIARISLPVNQLTGTCYVRVLSQGGEFAIGSYALVAYYSSTLETPASLITETASWNYSHLSQGDARYLFRDGPENFFFADDNHTDDTLATAMPLDPLDLPVTANLHRIDASIADAIDRDFYLFDVPREFDGLPLTISIHSRDAGLLIPDLVLTTDDGLDLPFTRLTNGNGLQVIQLDQAPSGGYAVSVSRSPSAAAPFQTGNYTLEIRSDRDAVVLTSYGLGEAVEGTSEHHTLRIARAQMFHFALEGFSDTANQNAVLYASLYNEDGVRVYRVATRANEFRSSQSVLLTPGNYVLRVEVVTPSGSSQRIAYQFWGSPDADNEGPTILDPTLSPFPSCDPNRDVYCYPEGRFSDPFIWVDGVAPDLNPPSAPKPPWDNVDQLYWPDYAIA